MEINNLLFLDIETVPIVKDFEKLDERTKELFRKKFAHKLEEVPDSIEYSPDSTHLIDKSDESKYKRLWKDNAALYAEFSRVACVSMGLLSETQDGLNLKLHSIISRNEKTLLTELATVFAKIPNHSLVGHNIKDFDAPYLTRRFFANGISIPKILNVVDRKPWEISWKDTMEMWAAGQFKYKCSLDLLCNVFGIESPKTDMDGSQVAGVFYYESKADELPFDQETAAFKKISDYCQADVLACAKCFLVMSGSDKKIVTTSH